MFEAAEVGSRVSAEEYRERLPVVRAHLLRAQRRLAVSRHSVVILVGGGDGTGKDEAIDSLMAWMDTRGIETHAMSEITEEEREHPRFWRFWRHLPATGSTAIFFGSWYSLPINKLVSGEIDQAQFEQDVRRISDFERMLTDEKVIVIKFLIHLSRKDLEKRIDDIQSDPRRRWRLHDGYRYYLKEYQQFRAVSEHCLRCTSIGEAPWHIVEGVDPRYRDITIATTIAHTIDTALDDESIPEESPKPDLPVPPDYNILRQLDMSVAMERDRYSRKLQKYQGALAQLTAKMRDTRHSLLLVFEGPDAAGKGGAIRRLTTAMDARNYRVISVGAPTDEETSRPYLWRFWRHLPRQGRVTIYDRSWYGRVLVERIEGFCRRQDWQRAYSEINEFELQLSEAGIVVIKFWIALSPQEQLQRFKDRELKPYKQYKLTEEDWRNREKWDAYEAAACDMFERTSTDYAPWVLVEGDDKRWARIKILKTVVQALENRL